MGSSGGGSSSGMVDFPGYMKDWHTSALGGATGTTTTTSVSVTDPDTGVTTVTDTTSTTYEGGPDITLTQAMNEVLDGPSPYAGFVGVSADSVMLGTGKHITDFTAPYALLSSYATLNIQDLIAAIRVTNPITVLANNIPDLVIAVVNAESALLDSDINQTTLPQFQNGMRDINAIMGSAFVVGESIIWSQKAKALAKTDATLRYDSLKLQIDTTVKAEDYNLRIAVAQSEVQRAILTMAGDFAKLYAVMRTELDNNNLEIVAKDKLWDVKVFQYGGNFLGSIAGSAVSTDGGTQGNKAAAIASTVIGIGAAGASLYSSMSAATAGSSAATNAASGVAGALQIA